MVHRLAIFQFLAGPEDMVLGSTEAEGLFPLGLGAGEHHNVTSHGGGQLDSQVAQATNAHHTHSIGRADTVLSQACPNCGASAHQRGSICRIISFGDRNHTASIPDSTTTERSNVVVM